MTTEQTAVAATPEQSTAAVEYSQTLAGLQDLRARTEKVVYAVATTAGMEAARRDRRECVSLRTSLDKLRLQKNDDDHKRIKARNTAAKWLEAEIVAIEGPIDQQITAEEQRRESERQAKIEAERQRVAGIREAIDGMKRKCGNAISMTAAQVEEEIRALVDYDPVNAQAFFAEFHAEAVNAHAAALDFLRDLHAKKVTAEAEAEQLRKDREDLDRRTREQEKRDHEATIEREALERKEADERAERERLARVEREAKERKDREQLERDQEQLAAQQAQVRKAEMALSEIRGIQQQVIIAQSGRLGVRTGGTIACIEETIAETEQWPVDQEHFGDYTQAAVEAKDQALLAMRALLSDRRQLEQQRLDQAAAQARIDAERERQEQAKRDEEAAAEEQTRLQREVAERREADEQREIEARAAAARRADEMARMLKKAKRPTAVAALLWIVEIASDDALSDTEARKQIQVVAIANTPKEAAKAAESEAASVRG